MSFAQSKQTPETLFEKFQNTGGLEENENLNQFIKPTFGINGVPKTNLTFGNSSILNNSSPFVGVKYLDKNTIKYKVRSGDTFEKIANYFNTNAEDIKKLNNAKYLKTNMWLTIKTSDTENKQKNLLPEKNLPTIKNFFSLPATGWNWGILHNYNAVDISNKCGTPIYAAADGIVINDKELSSGSYGWNNGYGIFVLLEHQNGTKTRYAHLDKSLVKVGDIVKKGDKIGLMGNTGNSEGPTGCHLHFEIYGAKNPFASN